MLIGILSDTHNDAHNTQVALQTFRERGITRLIHCGDITTPEIVYLFGGWDVIFVWGNGDHDERALTAAAQAIGAPPPQTVHTLEVDGVQIAVTHGHKSGMLADLIAGGEYAYVCHGHTHLRKDDLRPPFNVRVINPGALGGVKLQSRSVCVLDTDTAQVEFIEFPSL